MIILQGIMPMPIFFNSSGGHLSPAQGIATWIVFLFFCLPGCIYWIMKRKTWSEYETSLWVDFSKMGFIIINLMGIMIVLIGFISNLIS